MAISDLVGGRETTRPESEGLAHPAYRPDIDGLRAIAILSVVGFHVSPTRISGGFVGVDIFFVISGFLISSIIFRNFSTVGFSYKAFYSRRIKRIFPALLALFVTLFAVGGIVILPLEFRQLGKYVAAGAAFVSNFDLWKEAGYFDAASNTKPLLHLWSLAIEEQFYLLWPLLLGLVWKRRENFLIVTLIVATISFAINIYLASSDPIADFYSPLSRFWELMIGGILSYITLNKAEPGLPMPNVQSAIGLALIISSIWLLNEDVVFPGWWALLPTVGTFLVISAGPQAWLNRHLLGNRLAVAIGLISYPLYLWHWPLLSIATMNGANGRLARVLLVVVSIVLAWITYQFIEKPIRRSKSITTPLLLLAGIVLSGLIGLLLYEKNASNDPQYAAYIMKPTELADRNFIGAAFDGNKLDALTIKGSSNDVALFSGDSHMGQYYPAIKQLYEDKTHLPHYSAVLASHANCTPSPQTSLNTGDLGRHHYRCDDLFRTITRMARAQNVKVVVFAGNWRLTPKYDQSSLAAFGASIKDLVARGKRVVVILDNPQGDEFDPLVIMRRHHLNQLLVMPNFSLTGDRFIEIDVPRRESKLRMGELAAVVKANGGQIVDPYDFLCSPTACPIVLAGKPTHVDSDHLRAFYVIQKASFIRALLSP